MKRERETGRRGNSCRRWLRAWMIEYVFALGVGILLMSEPPLTFASVLLGAIAGILFLGVILGARRVFPSPARPLRNSSQRGEGPGVEHWLRIYSKTWIWVTVGLMPLTALCLYQVWSIPCDEWRLKLLGLETWQDAFVLGVLLAPMLAIFASLPISFAVFWVVRVRGSQSHELD